MNNHFYTKEYGSYYFWKQSDDDAPLFMTDEVSVLFDRKEGILFKHGIPKNVEESRLAHLKAFEILDCVDDLVVIKSSAWDVEELNKIIQCSGYVKGWYEKSFNS